MAIYRLSETRELVAPVLIASFDGWVDAGSAATLAADQIAEGGAVIATFDADELFDYRARRPTLQIIDGQLRELSWPELTLRLSALGPRDVLVMSGPEPDYRWHAFAAAVIELARRLRVVEWISLGAIPAAVPHTRPVPIIGTASDPSRLRAGIVAGPEGIMRVPSAALSVLEMAMAAAGIPAVGYFAQVPHYVTGPSPAAALALLDVLADHLAMEIPRGQLAEQARDIRTRLDLATAADEATRAHVARLEERADEEHPASGDDLIADIERFLRDQGGGRG